MVPRHLRAFATIALALTLAGCPVTPIDQAGIHVTVEVRAPVDCLKLTVSDENKGPARGLELPVEGSAATTHLYDFAVLRDPEWGRNARIYPEGF
jgi:hypothetical protein